MTDKESPRTDPYQFILENIDSVPHLEALILFWNSRPVGWTGEEMASRLYVKPEQVWVILRDLVRLQVAKELSTSPVKFAYFPRSEEQNDADASDRRGLSPRPGSDFDHGTFEGIFAGT